MMLIPPGSTRDEVLSGVWMWLERPEQAYMQPRGRGSMQKRSEIHLPRVFVHQAAQTHQTSPVRPL